MHSYPFQQRGTVDVVFSHAPKVAVIDLPACLVVEGFELVEGALADGPRLAAVENNGEGDGFIYGHLSGPRYIFGSIYLFIHFCHRGVSKRDPAVDLVLAA